MRYNLNMMERKTKLYLDTSIINFAIDERTLAEKLITQNLLAEIQGRKIRSIYLRSGITGDK